MLCRMGMPVRVPFGWLHPSLPAVRPGRPFQRSGLNTDSGRCPSPLCTGNAEQLREIEPKQRDLEEQERQVRTHTQS